MAYSPNIPVGTEFPSRSQPRILNNFIAISNAFNKNHSDFNEATEGEHSLVDFVLQELPQLAKADSSLLFAADVDGTPEMFYGADGEEAKQITNIEPTTGGGTATSYSFDFINGLSLRFGLIPHNGTTKTITFDTPFASSAYVVFFTIYNGPPRQGMYVGDLSLESFRLRSTVQQGSGNYFYLAIGR